MWAMVVTRATDAYFRNMLAIAWIQRGEARTVTFDRYDATGKMSEPVDNLDRASVLISDVLIPFREVLGPISPKYRIKTFTRFYHTSSSHITSFLHQLVFYWLWVLHTFLICCFYLRTWIFQMYESILLADNIEKEQRANRCWWHAKWKKKRQHKSTSVNDMYKATKKTIWCPYLTVWTPSMKKVKMSLIVKRE